MLRIGNLSACSGGQDYHLVMFGQGLDEVRPVILGKDLTPPISPTGGRADERPYAMTTLRFVLSRYPSELTRTGLIAGLVLGAAAAHAVDPTSLEPAEVFTAKTGEVELEVGYADYDDSETEAELTVGYSFTPKWKLELEVPVEKEDGESTELGDVSLELTHTFNPDATKGPLVGVSLEVAAPTGDDSDGISPELKLHLAQPLGGAGSKHTLHLNLAEAYHASADDDERDFQYTAIAGYSYDVSESTTLVLDVVRMQLEDHGENANIIEAGVKHSFNDNVEVALGAGAGLGEESPDLTVHAGIGFRFGKGK